MFFDPHDNTVLAYISKIVQYRVLVTIIIQILDGGESTIQFTGRSKAIMDEAKPSPLSLF